MSVDKVSITIFIIVFWIALPIGFSLAEMGGYTPLTRNNDIVSMLENALTLNIYILPSWAKILIWIFRILSVLAIYLLLKEF